MKKNNINNSTLAAVNAAGRTILRAFNGCTPVNYAAPLKVYEINGPFTTAQIKNTVNNDGFNTFNSVIFALVKDSHFNEYNLMKLTAGDTIITDYKPKYYDDRTGARLDHFITKGSYNDDRKKENAHAFIICQLNEYLKPETTKNAVDFAGRFKLVNINKWAYNTGGASYIGSLDLIRMDASGEKVNYKAVYCRGHEITDAGAVIDKSGYIVNLKRVDLKERAEKLRAERAKNDYTKTDNTAEINALYAAIMNKKAEIVNALNAATTAAEINAVCEKLNRWNGFPEIMTAFERLKENDVKKEYSTIERYTAAFNRVKDAINNL